MANTFKIQRFNPDKDKKPHYEEYRVELEQTDRVLDGLNTIKWTMDGSLTYRRSCAHGVCGSDAMRINGRNRLACKVLIRDVGEKVTIEPMLGFPVIKDLVVDMDSFFDKYKSIKPYLITHDPDPVGPASIVNAHRFIFDSRDQGASERLSVLSDRNGVWRCRTIFNCTDA